MIKAIESACVMISNKARSIEWYTKTLGFELRPISQGHLILVGMPKSDFSLHLCEPEFPGATLEPGNTGILLVVDDVKKTVDELKAKGVTITQDVTVEPWATYAQVADPDGNVFWLMAF